MPAPATVHDFLDLVRKSNQVEPTRLQDYLQKHRGDTLPPDPKKFAALLVREGLLTAFQAEQFLQGKYKGFLLGGYRILDRLGSGGSGTVYLGEHQVMKRRVAIKVLPANFASEPAMLERFRREAQAAGALDHPNIARAYDFRTEGQVHFLVMEYVNGPSLEQVIESQGPLSVPVACEYVRQAAIGLAHAHETGMVHRDVKPGNLLVDSSGVVKILDMGLARFVPEGQESLTKQFDEHAVMGTADYLAPEQALSLHNVDGRADIYSLGATLYALLIGEAPFASGTVTQKLLWHQMRDPTPLRQRRADVPEEVAAVVARMMAKDLSQRYQTALEVADALAPYCATTPTSQGPARPGDFNGTGGSAYVKATTPAPPRKRQAEPEPDREAITDKPVKAVRPERKRDPEIRRKPAKAASQAGTWILGGVVAGVLLLGGSAVAYLVLGKRPATGDGAQKSAVASQPGPAAIVGLPERASAYAELRGHSQGTERLAYTQDGKTLLSSSKDKTIRIWNLLDRSTAGVIKGHEGHVLFVRFNAAGNQVLSCSGDGTARIWSYPDGKQLHKFEIQPGRVLCALYGRTENEIVTSGEDGIVRVHNVKTGKLVKSLTGHKGPVNGLAMRPGPGDQVVSACHDKTLKVWDLNTGKEVRTLKGHTHHVNAVAVSPDGQHAASASYDGSVRVWNLNSGQETAQFRHHKGAVWSVAFGPDNRRVLSGGVDKLINLYDVGTMSHERTYEGHLNSITDVMFSPDGKQFASCSLDTSVRLWTVSGSAP